LVFFTQSLWHICQWLLQLILLSHSGTFASDCCNQLWFFDLAQLPFLFGSELYQSLWHICQWLLQLYLLIGSGTIAISCCN